MRPADPGDEGMSREDHSELLGRYVRTLVAGAGGRPLVVFVDDAHLLDDRSATLVHQLALRTATVLATVQSGESAPDRWWADMHLSVRTIENHLQQVYEKLGVSGRHELAEALRDHPTV